MKMKAIIIAGACLLAMGCMPERQRGAADSCPRGDIVETTYGDVCIYRPAIAIEPDFTCPPGFSIATPVDDYVVCTTQMDIPVPVLEQAIEDLEEMEWDIHDNPDTGEDDVGTLPDADDPPRPDGGFLLTVGGSHGCLLLPSGKVKCWGSNDHGQLGDGTREDRMTPVEVQGLEDVVSVSAGWAHTCALLRDGSLECWGGAARRTAPQKVEGLSGLEGVAAGYHGYDAFPDVVCVWMDSGRVKCWGRDFPGVPTEVPGLSDAIHVVTGYFHACALLQSGGVSCWGDPRLGYDDVPVAIMGLANPVQVTAHRAHSCALVQSDRVKCWGHNWFGQLGDGTITDDFTPVDVLELSDAKEISPGGAHHSCALLHSGSARCWGMNTEGQLGDGTTTDRTTPVDVLELSDAVQIASGAVHTCALLDTEEVKCWGSNRYGQLGDGTTAVRLAPVYVQGLQAAGN